MTYARDSAPDPKYTIPPPPPTKRAKRDFTEENIRMAAMLYKMMDTMSAKDILEIIEYLKILVCVLKSSPPGEEADKANAVESEVSQ